MNFIVAFLFSAHLSGSHSRLALLKQVSPTRNTKPEFWVPSSRQHLDDALIQKQISIRTIKKALYKSALLPFVHNSYLKPGQHTHHHITQLTVDQLV
ncbi:MAG TPA: hypothetical protein DEO64_04180 [Alcaligenes faecalis]|nr:hypothetical protein [Alcaligenes faecalis]